MPGFHEQVGDALAGVRTGNYRITSSASLDYNCVAWALGFSNAWWWPTPGRFWPEDVPRETLPAFLAAFAGHGYAPCESRHLEPLLEKIAIYAVQDKPTHAARQLSTGAWTSKLGPSVDIEHSDLSTLEVGFTGT